MTKNKCYPAFGVLGISEIECWILFWAAKSDFEFHFGYHAAFRAPRADWRSGNRCRYDEGDIEEINIRSMTVRTLNNVAIIVPIRSSSQQMSSTGRTGISKCVWILILAFPTTRI